MKYRIIFLFIGLYFFATQLSGQYLEKGPKDKIIVIFPDGSWRYYEDADSIYAFKPQEPLSKKEQKRIEKERKKQEEAERRLAEEQAKKDRKENKQKPKTIESSAQSEPEEKLSKKEEKKRRKELQAEIEEDLARYRAEKEAEDPVKEEKSDPVTIEGNNDNKNKKGNSNNIDKLAERQDKDLEKQQKEQEKLYNKRVKEENKLIRKENELRQSLAEIQTQIQEEESNTVQVITETDISKAQKQDKKIQKYRDKEFEILQEIAALDQQRAILDQKYVPLDASTLTIESHENAKRNTIRKPESFNITYSEQVNVINHPPKTDCKLVFDDKKPGTSDLLREVAAEPISSYTPANLKPFYKDDDQIKIYANASSLSGGYRYLNLEIHVHSKSALKDYGNFRVGQPLNVMDLNKDVYTFPINFLAPPELLPDREGYVFKASFQMDNQSMKKIEKNYLDRIRIVWNTGFEEYEVYNIDFLERHLDCLNQ